MLHLFRSELTFCWYFNSVSLTFKHIHESRETRQAFIFELALFIRPKSEKWWLKFGRDFEAEFRSRLWGWCLVEIFETFDMTCYTSSHLVRALKPRVGCASGNCSSQPSMVHWLSSSIFPCSVVCLVGWPAMVTPVQISLLVAPHPKTHTFSESLR